MTDKKKKAKDAADLKKMSEDANKQIADTRAQSEVNARMRKVYEQLKDLGFNAKIVPADEVKTAQNGTQTQRDTTKTTPHKNNRTASHDGR